MNHFLADNKLLSASLPEIFSDELQPLLPRHLQASGSLRDTVCTFPDHNLPLQTESASMDLTIESPNGSVKLPSHSESSASYSDRQFSGTIHKPLLSL